MEILLLLAGYLSLFASGEALHQVFGLSNSSINLTTTFDPSNVKDLSWKREINKIKSLIAKFRNYVSDTGHEDRYILFDNATVLCINNLTKKDSGRYYAMVTFLDNMMKEEELNVTIYEPVPLAKIRADRIRDQCNVTLYCSVPSNASDLSYMWKHRHRDSEYQSVNNSGNKIQISKPLDHQDVEVMCIVYNPADQKNVSVLIEGCSEKWNYAIIGILIAALLFAILVMVVLLKVCCKHCKKATGKGNQEEVMQTDQNENDKKRKKKTKQLNKNGYISISMEDIRDHKESVQKHRTEEQENNANENEALLISHCEGTQKTTVMDDQQDERVKTHVVEVHKSPEDESGEHLISPFADTRNNDAKVRTQAEEKHVNNGHDNDTHDNDGHSLFEDTRNHDEEGRAHVVDEHNNDGHDNEVHSLFEDTHEENGEKQTHKENVHGNKEHLKTPVEDSREQVEEVQTHGQEKHENDKNLTIPAEKSDGREESQADQNENEEKEHDKDECEEKENLKLSVQEKRSYKVWRADPDVNMVKKCEKDDEHLNRNGFSTIPWKDTNERVHRDERVQKDKVVEREKKDVNENGNDATLVEKTGDRKGELRKDQNS